MLRMFGRRRGSQLQVPPVAWDRRRLVAMLAAALVVLVALLAGVGMTVWYAVGGSLRAAPTVAATADAAPQAGSVRDRIAAAPMASLDRQAAFTPESSVDNTALMSVPLPFDDDLGVAEVAVGFPHTPAGAVGQWAAIERRVLEAMDTSVLSNVHEAWVAPGGPGIAEWDLTRSVQAFLTSARQSGHAKDVSTLVSARPAGAMVKGTDGPDWVLACVLLDVRVVVNAEARMGYGLCARMVWVTDRWMVGPGAQPAPAPSAWPGSATAAGAGWLAWRDVAGRQR